MLKYISTAVIFSGALGITVANAAGTAAQANNKPQKQVEQTRLGVLSCEVNGGIGLFIGSSKGVNCEFTHAGGPLNGIPAR